MQAEKAGITWPGTRKPNPSGFKNWKFKLGEGDIDQAALAYYVILRSNLIGNQLEVQSLLLGISR